MIFINLCNYYYSLPLYLNLHLSDWSVDSPILIYPIPPSLSNYWSVFCFLYTCIEHYKDSNPDCLLLCKQDGKYIFFESKAGWKILFALLSHITCKEVWCLAWWTPQHYSLAFSDFRTNCCTAALLVGWFCNQSVTAR